MPHHRFSFFLFSLIHPPYTGKLGITIDTTPNGPAVHKIKDESQMNGVLRIGDIILKIDDVETTSMSASAISALMVKTEDKERTLTVLGDEP